MYNKLILLRIDIHGYIIYRYTHNHSTISVCFNIKVNIANQVQESFFTRKWELGSCSGPEEEYWYKHLAERTNEYQSGYSYGHRCCLRPGAHLLICSNEASHYGWGDGFVEIFGQRYCDDFVGFKTIRRIEIKCKHSISSQFLSYN